MTDKTPLRIRTQRNPRELLPSVNELLADAAQRLRPKKIRRSADRDEGRLDAEILLAYALGKDRAWIVAHGEDRLSGMLRRRFENLVARRAEREPVAYIIGEKEFYGRSFAVNRNTLIPRPETELFIDILKSRFKRNDAFTLWDIGTGAGLIAITTALEFPKANVVASDNSSRALALAKKNATSLNAKRITFVKGDLLSPLPPRPLAPPLLIAANLPYLPERDATKLDRDVVDYEPHEALFAGKDGLDAIRALFTQISDRLNTLPDGILIEFDPPQAKALKKIAAETFPTMTMTIHNDLAGRNRVMEMKKS